MISILGWLKFRMKGTTVSRGCSSEQFERRMTMAWYAPKECRKSTIVAVGWAPAHVKAVKGAIRIQHG